MVFTPEVWKQQATEQFQQARSWLKQRATQDAPYLVYGTLGSLSLWPLVEAAQAGQLLPVVLALGHVAGGVGGNLLANQIQIWKDQADELTQDDVAEWITEQASLNPELSEALDTILEQMEAIAQVQAGLGDNDRQWFVETLRAELAHLGNLNRFEGTLIVQGDHGQVVIDSQVGGDVIAAGGQKIENHYHDRQPGPDAVSLQNAYLNHLFESGSPLSLAGVDPKTASESEARLNLSEVYTALLTLSQEHHDRLLRGEMLSSPGSGGEGRRLSALEQLNRHQHLVFLGDPGSGKSTFVNFVTICLAGESLGRSEANLARLTAPLPDDQGQAEEKQQPWDYGPLLPVRVILRDFAARGLPDPGQPATAKHLWDFIVAELGAVGLEDYAPHLRQTLMKQGGLLLLDGLDEVPAANQRREQLKQVVESFAGTYPNCRIIVTSRTYAYQKQEWRLSGFSEAVLAVFSAGQIRRFVDGWYAHIAGLRGLHQDDAQGRAELLKRAIFNSERLQDLAERPLLLTLMASLHAWRGGSLPEKREELYADTVDLLLDWWESPKVVRDKEGQVVVLQPSLAEWLKVDKEKVRELLNKLAYQAHAGQPDLSGTADVAEGKLVSGLMRLTGNPEVNPARLVEYLSQRAGLLLPRGVGVYTFPHRTFQEYLTACYLTNYGYPGQVAELARQEPNRWREVTLLAGAKAARGSLFSAWALVEALCRCHSEVAQDSKAEAWGALLAGQFLTETVDLTDISEWDWPKLERVQCWLMDELEGDTLPTVERVAGGRILGHIGDTRPGVGLGSAGLPDIVWCKIPAGPFTMGEGDETHTVELPVYSISKYPVTNSQYRAFVADKGYQKESYWPEAIQADSWREGQIRRRAYESGTWIDEWATKPYDYGIPFNLPNHPQVGVNWWEMMAFCRWLTDRWQRNGEWDTARIVTLPSEAEWEKAARGPSTGSGQGQGTGGRRYPWGDEINPDRANYADTDLGTTSAVGCFPAGVGPYGCLDMSGNVWEWTRSIYQDYPYNPADGREDLTRTDVRVLRGGAFRLSVDLTRCAIRGSNDPRYRRYSIGFRCVLLAAPSS